LPKTAEERLLRALKCPLQAEGLLYVVAVLCFAALQGAFAQEGHGVTPAEIERGEAIYFTNCAVCHGPEGDGVSGVNLASGKFRKASTDRDLTGIIRNGIAGTEMPPGNYTEAVAGMVVAYLHSMSAASASRGSTLQGDAARGRAIAESRGKCLECHRVSEAGGFLGPDLSGIGMMRRAADLERSLREPGAEIRADNHTVRAVGKDGTTLIGRLLNQDTYTVQVILPAGELRTLRKADWREVEIQSTSPMPAATGLSEQDVADVVAWLGSLKGKAQ
jgi:putative heme-binding domain-containing protein